MTETKDQILERMREAMPFHLPERIRPYIEEAMQIYADQQLRLHIVSNWVAVKERKPDNCDQVFVKYENGKYGINEWWESDDCWKYEFDNMIVKEWCKPPCY